MDYAVERKSIQNLKVLTTREEILFSDLENTIEALSKVVMEERNGSIIILVYHPDLRNESTIRLCYPVKDINFAIDEQKYKFDTLEKTSVVSTIHFGEYDKLDGTAQFLTEYTIENNLSVTMSLRFLLLKGEQSYALAKRSPSDFITEIQIPVTEKN